MTSPRSALSAHRDGGAWWETAITEVADGRITTRGHAIDDLIEKSTFVQHMVLLFTGRTIDSRAARLLEAVMIAGADHGPLAPSIAAARMAATCGVTFNSTVATGINLLGNAHGGAAGDATRFMKRVQEAGTSVGTKRAAHEAVAEARNDKRPIPGFGHQLHTVDPRRAPVLAMLEQARDDDVINGDFITIGEEIEAALESSVGRPVPMNIDGLWGIVCCELDLPPDFAMGAFCLSRGAGIMAHAFEEANSGVRIKGPCPPGENNVRYVGP